MTRRGATGYDCTYCGMNARISYAQSVSLMVDLTIEGVWDSQSSSLKKIADNHPASDSTPISYSGRGI